MSRPRIDFVRVPVRRAREAMEFAKIDYYGDEGQGEYRSMLKKIEKARKMGGGHVHGPNCRH